MTPLLVLACLLHACSNDALVPPRIGDEALAWDAVEWVRPVEYELTANDGITVCWRGEREPLACRERGPRGHCPSREHGVRLHVTACAPRHNARSCIRVRACEVDGDCGPWSAECVEFVGHAVVDWRAP